VQEEEQTAPPKKAKLAVKEDAYDMMHLFSAGAKALIADSEVQGLADSKAKIAALTAESAALAAENAALKAATMRLKTSLGVMAMRTWATDQVNDRDDFSERDVTHALDNDVTRIIDDMMVGPGPPTTLTPEEKSIIGDAFDVMERKRRFDRRR
jgi:hypothetical protein